MGMTYFGKELFNYATDCEEARIQWQQICNDITDTKGPHSK
jgi:hypothetical protein